jgi:hypothetical protein
MSDGVFGGLSLAGTISGVGKGVIAAANKVDDVGRCMNALTRINLGACFTGDTLVQVTALAGEPSREPADDGSVATATLQTVSIATLPLGARVLAGNPRPEEMDHAFAEPEQATWVSVSVRMTKRDGTVVQAEFLRPREWVARHKILAGAALPIAITELEVEGNAIVTAISPCPQIATGEGRVVTGRFVTREAGNLVRVALENGTEIRATDVHPVWSVDREEWVPAGEIEAGEHVDTLAGPFAVLSVERLESAHGVYNIEVHGEHVFRVTADGVLVHNACYDHLPYAGELSAAVNRLPGSRAMDIRNMIPDPGGRQYPDPEKLLMRKAFSWPEFTRAIEIRVDGGKQYIMNGQTRIELALRAGITHLPTVVQLP